MRNVLYKVEIIFEKLVSKAVSILGHSLTFIIALIYIIYWLCDAEFYLQSRHKLMLDLIYAITFLSLFIIQKSVNHSSKVIQIKLNELVAAHENARTHLVNIETKTEAELSQLVKEYEKLAEENKEIDKATENKLPE